MLLVQLADTLVVHEGNGDLGGIVDAFFLERCGGAVLNELFNVLGGRELILLVTYKCYDFHAFLLPFWYGFLFCSAGLFAWLYFSYALTMS